MIWLLLSFFGALFISLRDVTGKKILRNTDEFLVSWSSYFFSIIFLLPVFLFIKMPHLNINFFLALAAGGCLNTVASVLYMKALKYCDLSLSVPMLNFTPLFLLITSPLILGESPKPIGIIGILLIIIGSYILNINDKHNSLAAPLKALFSEKGPRLMLLVALIFSITSNIDKIGVVNSSPFFWVFSINLFITAALLPVIMKSSQEKVKILREQIIYFALLGLFYALALIFIMSAIKLTLVAYVISIKRTSTLFAVIWGYLIFREKNIRKRFAGVSIMLLGVILIGLFS